MDRRAWSDAARSEHLRQLRAFRDALLPRVVDCGPGVEAAAAFRPAGGEVVGGDFHACVVHDERTSLVIGDVTGHGVPAALVMAVLYGALQVALRTSWRPCQVLWEVHQLLAELGARAGGPRLFSATAFVVMIEPSGRLVHAGAGHPSPILLPSTGAPRLLAPVTPPLGFAPPDACHESAEQLHPGDRLLLVTDGVLGEDASSAALVPRLLAAPDCPMPRLLEDLVAQGADDDRTAVLLRFVGVTASD